MRTTLALVAVVVVALSAVPGPAAGAAAGAAAGGAPGPVAAGAGAAAQGDDACEPVSTGSPREDPDEDALGWEGGCWYDESIDVAWRDGLNGTELAAVKARTMARVERIRELEFEETVPVEVINRSEFRQRTGEAFANATEKERLHQNVKFEALFFVDEATDALAEIRENRGGTILGFYDPEEDRLVVVSENEQTLELDELTLAHELAHAVQDQHFNISRYERTTTEENNAISGLIEGEANLVEFRYEQRCDAEWSCLPRGSSPSTPPGFHVGLYLVNYQPYSDGPAFVESIREEGGWAAVNDLYDAPPASSEQVIHPDKYPDETPVNVTVEDRSGDRWRILDLEEGVDYAVFGEAGLATMFVYPAFEQDSSDAEFVSRRAFINPGGGFDPFNYGTRYTDGWAGDKLYPYVTDDSLETNETGYVWKTVWDTPRDARQFADAYVRMLEFRNGEPVPGRMSTYRIPDGEPFGDAFYVERTDTTVVIVNAPTVEELPEVRAGAAPTVTPTPTPTPTPGGTPTATTGATPGFGPLVALLALLALGAGGLLARRRP